jgi:hypothetical protein
MLLSNSQASPSLLGTKNEIPGRDAESLVQMGSKIDGLRRLAISSRHQKYHVQPRDNFVG